MTPPPPYSEILTSAARTLEKQGRQVAELVKPDSQDLNTDAQALHVYTRPDRIGRVYTRVAISMERIGRIESRKPWPGDPYAQEVYTSLFDKFGNFLLTIGSGQNWWIRPV
jgi:hypothetical protein